MSNKMEKMNIIRSNGKYQIYNDEIKTYNALPPNIYKVFFNKMSGFYLSLSNDIEIDESKIYGNTPSRVDKALRSYQNMNRNFGVLLSGEKGVGKSLFVKKLAQESIKIDLPVILVNYSFPGLADFISSINQDCVVIFDEFEKVFSANDDYDPQTELLSLFDGMDGGHKLFLVTVNDLSKISQYMINRPGRFHYHFSLTAPSADEVREYMLDKLNSDFVKEIDDVVSLSGVIPLPYDCLRAIAFELNQGYSLKEALADLNITRTDVMYFDVELYLKDGTCFEAWHEDINILDKYEKSYVHVRNFDLKKSFSVEFYAGFARLENGAYVITDHIIQPKYDEDDFWEYPEDERATLAKEANENIVTRIVLKKCKDYSTKFFN